MSVVSRTWKRRFSSAASRRFCPGLRLRSMRFCCRRESGLSSLAFFFRGRGPPKPESPASFTGLRSGTYTTDHAFLQYTSLARVPLWWYLRDYPQISAKRTSIAPDSTGHVLQRGNSIALDANKLQAIP